MPTIAYDKLSSAAPNASGLATASGLVGYRPLSREVAPVAFNPFTYGQATGDQPTEAAFFRQGPQQEMVYPGAENAAYSFQMQTNKGRDAGTFTVAPDQKVRIVNRKTGEVYFEGIGPEDGLRVAQIGESLSKSEGKKANWRIETMDATGGWTKGAQDKKASGSLLGKIAGVALPALGAIAGTALGIGPVAGAALGGAGGAAAQGKGIGGILKGAALGAGTAALGGALGNAGFLGNLAGTTAGRGIGYGLANTAGGLVQGQSLKNALIGGIGSGLLYYGGASLGGRTPNAASAAGGQPLPGGEAVADVAGGASRGGILGSIGNLSAKDLLRGAAATSLIGQAASGIGGLGGGGGGAPMGSSSVYSPTGTELGQIIAAPAYTGPTDIYAVPAANVGRYKKGGKVKPENDNEMVRHLREWQKGRGHHGPGKVKGIGSGQEDLIPAWLSDGEYVWSAQDVADLGDGSTDEGVRRLDKMRHMVRKQAGRKDIKKIAKPQKGIDHMLKAVGGRV